LEPISKHYRRKRAITGPKPRRRKKAKRIGNLFTKA